MYTCLVLFLQIARLQSLIELELTYAGKKMLIHQYQYNTILTDQFLSSSKESYVLQHLVILLLIHGSIILDG